MNKEVVDAESAYVVHPFHFFFTSLLLGTNVTYNLMGHDYARPVYYTGQNKHPGRFLRRPCRKLLVAALVTYLGGGRHLDGETRLPIQQGIG